MSLGYSFNGCKLFKINDRNALRPCLEENITTEDDVGELITDMVESPKRFGMIISKGFLDHSNSKRYILLSLALNLIPEDIKYVVSTDPIWIETGHVNTFERLGVAVLMDPHNLTSFKTVIPEDAFRSDFKDGSFWETVPDDVREYMDYLAEQTVLNDWFRQFKNSVPPLDEEICEIWKDGRFSAMVDTLSFGRIQYCPRHWVWKNQLPQWAKPLVEEYLFCWRDAYAGSLDENSKAIVDVFSIWSTRLKGTGALSKISPDMDDSKRKLIQDLGREMGIDKDLDALLVGVPVEDILAA